MSDNTAIIALVAIIVMSLTTCTISGRWAHLEEQKIQLERDRLGK